jgi:hypothetical protein
MTPDEQQMLNDLANKVAQTPPPQRDPQAEEFIRTRIGSRPDALYLMTQTVLIQNLALEHAKQQIQELQQKVSAVPAPGQQPSSFLGGVAPVTPRGSGWGSQPGSYSTPPPAPPPVVPPSAPASGGASSFLRSAATTAAGVAAGALAFEGIRALFSGSEHIGGFGGGPQFGGGSFLGGGVAPSETIINNYYETPEREARGDSDDDDRDDDDSSDDSPDDSDSSDDSDDSSDDGSYDDSSDDNLV